MEVGNLQEEGKKEDMEVGMVVHTVEDKVGGNMGHVEHMLVEDSRDRKEVDMARTVHRLVVGSKDRKEEGNIVLAHSHY
jgi:hypothetical protein